MEQEINDNIYYKYKLVLDEKEAQVLEVVGKKKYVYYYDGLERISSNLEIEWLEDAQLQDEDLYSKLEGTKGIKEVKFIKEVL